MDKKVSCIACKKTIKNTSAAKKAHRLRDKNPVKGCFKNNKKSVGRPRGAPDDDPVQCFLLRERLRFYRKGRLRVTARAGLELKSAFKFLRRHVLVRKQEKAQEARQKEMEKEVREKAEKELASNSLQRIIRERFPNDEEEISSEWYGESKESSYMPTCNDDD